MHYRIHQTKRDILGKEILNVLYTISIHILFKMKCALVSNLLPLIIYIAPSFDNSIDIGACFVKCEKTGFINLFK